MKELSIEEKAKAYDEAIKRAREYDFSLTGVCAGDIIEDVFPELKEPESEDLEQAAKEWLRPQLDKYYVNYGEAKMMELTRFDGYAMLDAIEFGANWKEQQFEKNRLKNCNSITNEHD